MSSEEPSGGSLQIMTTKWTDSKRTEALRLPTPGPPPPIPHKTFEAWWKSAPSSSASSALLTAASTAFSFPYAQAYPIQLDLMRGVYGAIEQGQVGIFESPTGTGKSLSLLCASLTWLEQQARRSELGVDAQGLTSAQASAAASSSAHGGKDEEEEEAEPEWVLSHAATRQRADATRKEEELRQRIARAKKLQARFKRERKAQEVAEKQKSRSLAGGVGAAKQQQLHQQQQVASGSGKAGKRKPTGREGDSDEEFLLDDDSGSSAAKKDSDEMDGELAAFLGRQDPSSTSGGSSSLAEPDLFLTPEVRQLMSAYSSGSGGATYAVHDESTGRATGWRAGSSARAEEMEELISSRAAPQVYFASRTHSQLSQFVAELNKTRFGKGGPPPAATAAAPSISDAATAQKRKHIAIGLEGRGEDEDAEDAYPPLRVVALGSRKQMCIHDEVQRIGNERGTEAMNERCKELLKGKPSSSATGAGSKYSATASKRCPYAPSMDEQGLAQVLDFRDHAFTSVRDIEDLTSLGRSLHTCPYFASRLAAKQAQLVTLPYNLLLHSDSRAAAQVDVRDAVVVVDEAHNLIDTILEAHTVLVTLAQLDQAARQIETYVQRFAARLKGSSEMQLRQMLLALRSLVRFCQAWCKEQEAKANKSSGPGAPAWKGQVKEDIITSSQLVGQLGGTLDQINLSKLEAFLKESQIARKVAGYADKQAERKRLEALQAKGRSAPLDSIEQRSSIASMHAIGRLLLSLAAVDEDGKVLLSLSSSPSPSPGSGVKAEPAMPSTTIKYQLLNPSRSFRAIADEARAVVLAGGTMEPVSDLLMQVFPHLDPRDLARVSCGHVIPKSNLFASAVSVGPRKTRFEFKFDNRGDHALIDDLGAALHNFCNIVPHGVVVFLPSYKVLDTYVARWTQSKQLEKIGKRKKVFLEPKSAADVESTLQAYSTAIDASPSTGAILFAVVGAKLSEGINFSDRLARAVVMVGLPFPNAASAELSERMRYARELASKSKVKGPDAGKELYVNMCMKAVNQSIGRAIRHRNDYAALLLLDVRYGRNDIKGRLPGWIRDQVQTSDAFGSTMSGLAQFFRGKTG